MKTLQCITLVMLIFEAVLVASMVKADGSVATDVKTKSGPKIRRTVRVRQPLPPAGEPSPGVNVRNSGPSNNIEVKPSISVEQPKGAASVQLDDPDEDPRPRKRVKATAAEPVRPVEEANGEDDDQEIQVKSNSDNAVQTLTEGSDNKSQLVKKNSGNVESVIIDGVGNTKTTKITLPVGDTAQGPVPYMHVPHVCNHPSHREPRPVENHLHQHHHHHHHHPPPGMPEPQVTRHEPAGINIKSVGQTGSPLFQININGESAKISEPHAPGIPAFGQHVLAPSPLDWLPPNNPFVPFVASSRSMETGDGQYKLTKAQRRALSKARRAFTSSGDMPQPMVMMMMPMMNPMMQMAPMMNPIMPMVPMMMPMEYTMGYPWRRNKRHRRGHRESEKDRKQRRRERRRRLDERENKPEDEPEADMDEQRPIDQEKGADVDTEDVDADAEDQGRQNKTNDHSEEVHDRPLELDDQSDVKQELPAIGPPEGPTVLPEEPEVLANRLIALTNEPKGLFEDPLKASPPGLSPIKLGGDPAKGAGEQRFKFQLPKGIRQGISAARNLVPHLPISSPKMLPASNEEPEQQQQPQPPQQQEDVEKAPKSVRKIKKANGKAKV